MSSVTARATDAVRSGVTNRHRICTLSSFDADLQVNFAPEYGMLACSMLHSGEELLGQRGGLAAYARSGATMGIPLLYPWAEPARRLQVPLRRADRGDRRRHPAR